jgi:hypothetical protein
MKTVRLRTKAGEIRFTSLAPFTELPSWWSETKFRGGVIGNNWCLPFDEIAVADLVDVPDNTGLGAGEFQREQQRDLQLKTDEQVRRMAAGIGAGLWTPPGEKQ